MPATKHEHEREPDWIIALRRTPAGPRTSPPEEPGAETFEVICRECGDDPALDYKQVSAELQQIRGHARSAPAAPRSTRTSSPTPEPRCNPRRT